MTLGSRLPDVSEPQFPPPKVGAATSPWACWEELCVWEEWLTQVEAHTQGSRAGCLPLGFPVGGEASSALPLGTGCGDWLLAPCVAHFQGSRPGASSENQGQERQSSEHVQPASREPITPGEQEEEVTVRKHQATKG